MSNYPPSQSFGGPYQYNGYYPQPPVPLPPSSSGGAYHAIIPQPTRLAQHIGTYSQHAPQHSHAGYYANQYGYNMNMQIPRVVPGNADGQPSPNFHNYGNFSHNTLPPPPYPPVPIPNYPIISPRPPPSNSQIVSTSTLQPDTSLPPKPTSVEVVSRPPVLDSNYSVPSYGRDREDGELSDSEVPKTLYGSKSTTPSRLPTGGSALGNDDYREEGIVQSGRAHEKGRRPTIHGDGVVGSSILTDALTAETHIKSGFPVDRSLNGPNEPIVTAPQQNPSSYVLQSQIVADDQNELLKSQMSDNEFRQPSKRPPQRSVALEDDHNRLVDLSTQTAFRNNATNVPDVDSNSSLEGLRTKAKIALQDLYRNHIGFEQLSSEGVDVSLLRELYLEAGINIDEAASPRIRSPEHTSGLSVTVTSQDQSTMSSNGPSRPALASNVPTYETFPEVRTLPAQKEQNKNVDMTQRPVEEESAISRGINGTQILSQPHEPCNSTPPTNSASKLKPDRTIERKDYIARMLAARTNKTSIEKSSQATVPSKSLGLATQDTVTEKSMTNSRPKSPTEAPSSSSSAPEADTHSKKKAQMELLRQKTEALKRTSTLHGTTPASAQIPQSLQTTSPSAPTVEFDPNSKLVGPYDQPSPQPQLNAGPNAPPLKDTVESTYTPTTPFFASLERPWLDGLPGLSSSSKPKSQSLHISDPIASSNVKADQVVVCLNSPRSPADDIGPMSDRAVLASRESSTTTALAGRADDIVADPVRITSPTLNEMERSRKRAMAADFIDVPVERIKRLTGSSGHVQVFIEVSDDDDDDNDDDGKMEVDSGLPAPLLRLPDQSTYRVSAAREQNPLINSVSRSIAQVSSSIHTPPLVQTPGKTVEQEGLARTEEKIRALKQKIAETERRKRAKENSSGVRTPASTLQQTPKSPSNRSVSPAGPITKSEGTTNMERVIGSTDSELQPRIDGLGTAQVSSDDSLDMDKRAHAINLVRAKEDSQGAARGMTASEKESLQQRKLALEAALPAIDTQIKKARLKLASLEKQKGDCEKEIKRGSEKRRLIIEEIDTLLISSDAAKKSKHDNEHTLSPLATVSNGHTTMQGMSIPSWTCRPSHYQIPVYLAHQILVSVLIFSVDELIAADSALEYQMEQTMSASDQPLLPQINKHIKSPPGTEIGTLQPEDQDGSLTSTHTLRPRQMSEPSILDTSNLVGNDPIIDAAGSDTDAHQDEYEPTLDDDMHSPQSSAAVKSTYSADDELDFRLSSRAQPVTGTDGKVSQSLEGRIISQTGSIRSSSREEGEMSTSESSADADDPDDYEPPEAVSVVDDTMGLPVVDLSRSETPMLRTQIKQQGEEYPVSKVSQTNQATENTDNPDAKPTVLEVHGTGNEDVV